MTAPGLTLDIARAVVTLDATRRGVELVLPTDQRRTVVASVVALASPRWTRDEVVRRVSVTLPGSDPLLDPLSALPRVGTALALLARACGDGRTQVYLAPFAWDDPVECVAAWAHEASHAEQIETAARAPLGVARWVLGYAGSPEVRAGGAEGPAYTQDLAVRVVLGGWDVARAEDVALGALEGYALDDEGRALAEAQVGVAVRSLAAGARIGGPCVGLLRELAARGVAVPEVWR